MPSIQEESLPAACTPAFRPQPAKSQSARQGVTTRRTSDVPEGEKGNVTPPSKRKNITYTGDVITLDDSDEDKEDSTNTPCSPYHKCYETSRTPPCILRDKARSAEHNYNDLLELTNREKMFCPSTVELLERLEKTSMELVSTKEDLEKVKMENEISVKEISVMKEKLIECEKIIKEGINEKVTFEQEIEEYKTRITDLEVCLENCKQKSKQRELELLSLIEDKSSLSSHEKSRVNEKIQNSELSAFMNLSRDISLVGSDFDSSVAPVSIEKPHTLEEISNLQTQINEKNDHIKELTKKLTNSQQSIKMFSDELESTNNSKLMLQSSCDEYSKIISELNMKLEKASNDEKTYEKVISDLKLQLQETESKVQQKLASNNEEISGILKEFKNIKLAQQQTEESTCKLDHCSENCRIEIVSKVNCIDDLNKKLQELQVSLMKNDQVIENLNCEIERLRKSKEELICDVEKLSNEKNTCLQKIETLEELVKQLENDNVRKDELIKNLNIENINLTIANSDSSKENYQLNLQVNSANTEITKLQKELTTLNNIKSDLESMKDQLQLKNNVVIELERNISLERKEKDSVEINLRDIEIELDENRNVIMKKQRIIESLEKDLLECKECLEVATKKEKVVSNAITLLEKENDELKSKVRHSDEIIKQINNKTVALELQLEQLTHQWNTKNGDLNNLKVELEIAHDEIAKCHREIECNTNLVKEKLKLEEYLKLKDLEINSLQAQVHSMRRRTEDQSDRAAELESLKFELSDKDSKLTELEIKIKSLLDTDDNIESLDLDETLSKLEQLISSNKIALQENSKASAKIIDLEKTIENNASQNKHSDSIIKTQQDKLHLLENECVENKSKLKRLCDDFEALENILKGELIEKIFIFEKMCSSLQTIVFNKLANCEKTITSINNIIANEKENQLIKMNLESECYNPPKLITICTKFINESSLPGASSSLVSNCRELDHSREKLITLEKINRQLEDENIEVKKEVYILLELANDLNKKVSTHRTQLSTLAATMYAENKLLKTKFRALQHHHNRLHAFCNKEIHQLRTKLCLLQNVLASESKDESPSQVASYSANESTFKLDRNNGEMSDVLMSNVESIVECDTLMLAHNFTLGPSANSTMINYDHSIRKSTTTCDKYDVTDIEILNETHALSNLNSECDQNKYVIPNTQNVLLCCKKHLDDDSLAQLVACKINYGELDNLLLEALRSHSQHCVLRKYFTMLLDSYIKKVSDIENHVKELECFQKEKNHLKDQSKGIENMKKELLNKSNLIKKLEHTIEDRIKEYDSLSNEVMDLISENDSLKSQLNDLAARDPSDLNCAECIKKDEIIANKNRMCVTENILKESNLNVSGGALQKSFTKNNLSHEKICSLQSELLASQEECKKINEEVSAIKNTLFRSDDKVSVSIQDSSNENILSFNDTLKEYPPQNVCVDKCFLNYKSDKKDCLSFLISKNVYDDSPQNDKSVLEMMKDLYNKVWSRHGDELENLLNKLKQYEDDKNTLQLELDTLSCNYETIKEELQREQAQRSDAENKVNLIRHMVDQFNFEFDCSDDFNKQLNLKLNNVTENIVMPLGKTLGISASERFTKFVKTILDKCESNLELHKNTLNDLENKAQKIISDYENLKQNWDLLNCEFTKNTQNLSVLKEQKERLSEISKTVTLDLVAREEKLKDIVQKYSQGADNQLLPLDDTNDKVRAILEFKNSLICQKGNESEKLAEKLKEMTCQAQQKEMELQIIKSENRDLLAKENYIMEQTKTQKQIEDNFKSEINSLKVKVEQFQLNETEFVEVRKILETQLSQLKNINVMMKEEEKGLKIKLEQSSLIVNEQNNKIQEIESLFKNLQMTNESLTRDIRDLKEINTKQAQKLTETNALINDKNEQIIQLEKNIVTHQKATEIQASMCKRLRQEKEELENQLQDKSSTIEQLTTTCNSLQSELENLRSLRSTIEKEIPDLNYKSNRNSLEAIKTENRRRRQSMHDMHRTFTDIDEVIPVGNDDEEIFQRFSTAKDMFVESAAASRRNSMESKHDETNASSTDHITHRRKRRQSIHDMHRPSSVQEEIAGNEENDITKLQNENKCLKEELNKLTESIEKGITSEDHYKKELEAARAELAKCKEEYRQLEMSYKEVDEECELCAQNLRLAEDQCLKLCDIRLGLEKKLAEMQARLGAGDADAKYHATAEKGVKSREEAVDRALYEKEVEKRKSMSRKIEDFEAQNRALKLKVENLQLTVTQPKLDKENIREIESLRRELRKCQSECNECRNKYRTLREEYDTFVNNARTKETQLESSKLILETRLKEVQQSSLMVSGEASQSARKKRQSVHDSNRPTGVYTIDVATNTDRGAMAGLGVDQMTFDAEREKRRKLQDAFQQLKNNNSKLNAELRKLHSIVQADENTVRLLQSGSNSETDALRSEIEQLRSQVSMLSSRNRELEVCLSRPAPPPQVLAPPPHVVAPPTLLVATGSAIVQSQQLCDVLKENQKLKNVNVKLMRLCKKRGKSDADRPGNDQQ